MTIKSSKKQQVKAEKERKVFEPNGLPIEPGNIPYPFKPEKEVPVQHVSPPPPAFPNVRLVVAGSESDFERRLSKAAASLPEIPGPWDFSAFSKDGLFYGVWVAFRR